MSLPLRFRFSSGARAVLAACSFVALLIAPTVGSATTLSATDALGTYQFWLSCLRFGQFRHGDHIEPWRYDGRYSGERFSQLPARYRVTRALHLQSGRRREPFRVR